MVVGRKEGACDPLQYHDAAQVRICMYPDVGGPKVTKLMVDVPE